MSEVRHINFRMDFEIIPAGEVSPDGYVAVVLIPHRDRYEWQGEGKDRVLYDKLEDLTFPADVINRHMASLQGMPISYQPQTAGTIEEYIVSRLGPIEQMLSGVTQAPTHRDPSEDALRQFVGTSEDFAIASIDLVGSSALSESMPEGDYDRLVRTYLHELSLLVTHFLGHVLKYTGDGIIAYFAPPSYIIKNDHCADYAVAAHALVKYGLNPLAAKAGLPALHLRIGIDSGSIPVRVVGHDATKQHADLVGRTVNRACKIQAIAPKDGIAVGQTTVSALHTTWRLRCTAMDLPADWSFKAEDGSPYGVFVLA